MRVICVLSVGFSGAPCDVFPSPGMLTRRSPDLRPFLGAAT